MVMSVQPTSLRRTSSQRPDSAAYKVVEEVRAITSSQRANLFMGCASVRAAEAAGRFLERTIGYFTARGGPPPGREATLACREKTLIRLLAAARLNMYESVGDLDELTKVGSSRTCCGFVRSLVSIRSGGWCIGER